MLASVHPMYVMILPTNGLDIRGSEKGEQLELAVHGNVEHQRLQMEELSPS